MGLGQPVRNEGGGEPAFSDRLSRALGPNFEVLRLLGRGGFADVYEIRDRQLDRTLAVKVLRPEIAWGPWMVSRFEREARALASLNHINIPPIHFVGDNEGLVYYVMPVIAGSSLADLLLDSGPLEPGFVVDVMVPVLEALEHAHTLGIVHRDIKPDNIIIEQGSGRPLLVDFGVAKLVKLGTAGGSLPGVVMGTPGYISPEQAMAQDDIDARSDVYAVGATMFHLLTGTTTFPGEDASEIIGRQMLGEVPVPRGLNPQIPVWLSDVVVCALAARREDRFQTSAAMVEALRVGRRSGGLGPLDLPEPMPQIRENDPTPKMVPAATPPGAAPPWGHRASDRGREGDRRTRRKGYSPFSWTLLAGMVGTVAAYFVWVPVTVVIRNNLLLPVEISTDDDSVRTISAGATLSLPLSAGGDLLARWFIVQPRAQGSPAPAGEPVSGVLRVNALSAAELLRRRVSRSIASWSEGSVIFAPLVRNTTRYSLRIGVNRLPTGGGCACSVAPGEIRLLGYYRLEPNSSIQVQAPGERSYILRNLESHMDLNTGMVELIVDDSVLTRSPR